MFGDSIYRYIRANKLLKETSWSFAAKGVAFVLFIALNVFLARALGPEEFGRWSFFFSIITIFFLLSYFGLNASTQKFVAQYNQTDKLRSVLASSFRLRIVVSFLFSLLLLLLHRHLALLLGRPELESLFIYAVPLVFLAGVMEYLKQVFSGLHRIKYNFIVNILEYGLKFLFIVVFFNLSISLISIVNAFTLAMLLSSIIGSYLLYIRFYRVLKAPEHGTDYVRCTGSIIKYSLPLLILTFAFLIATEIDIIMLGMFSTNTEVGIYAAAKQVIIKIPHISLAIVMGIMPVFAKLNSSNHEELQDLLNKILKVNAIIMIPIVLSILFFSGYFIPLIFGEKYSASVLPLQILTVYLLCTSFSKPLSQFLTYRGIAVNRVIYTSGVIILNIILNMLLIPQYGAVGAAIATSVAFIPLVLLNWLEVKRVMYLVSCQSLKVG